MYEDKIDPVLAAGNLGEVSGGGSSRGKEKPDGTRDIEFCGIDIDTNDQAKVLIVLRKILAEFGAPDGTELQYTKDDQRLLDQFTNGRWLVAKSRYTLHPGFGI